MDHPKLKKEFLLSLALKACNDTLGAEGVVPTALLFGEFHSLRSFLEPKVPRATLAERAQAALTARTVKVEAQEKSRLKRAIKHQSPKMQNYTYLTGDKVLIWRKEILNNRIGEFIGPFTVLLHDERSKIIAIDHDGVIKRYPKS